MVREGDLGVRDDAGEVEGMGGITEVTLHPADQQWNLSQGCL